MAKTVSSKGSDDFDFMGDSEKTLVAGQKAAPKTVSKTDETATGGNPEEATKSEKKKDTGPPTPSGLSIATIKKAQALACSPKGLDIAAFMTAEKVFEMDIEAVLSFEIPK